MASSRTDSGDWVEDDGLDGPDAATVAPHYDELMEYISPKVLGDMDLSVGMLQHLLSGFDVPLTDDQRRKKLAVIVHCVNRSGTDDQQLRNVGRRAALIWYDTETARDRQLAHYVASSKKIIRSYLSDPDKP